MNKEPKPRVSTTVGSTNSESTSAKTGARSQSAKWAPSSKFNKILSSLEKSFLSQLGGGAHPPAAKQKQQSSRQKFNSSSSASTTTLKNNSTTQTTRSYDKRRNPEQVQKESHQVEPNIHININNNHDTRQHAMSRIALQSSAVSENESSKGKTTLNKYQQQIVSNMRSNPLLVNNKLSIPPPHANDEARNQSHRLLFGTSSLSKQSHDSNVHESPTKGQTDKAAANMQRELGMKIDAIRLNSSPAQLSRTLSTKSGSQNNKSAVTSKNNDEEDFGFSTYQSRRSLFASTASLNTNPTTATINKTVGLNNSHTNSNMILMQSANQMPMHPFSFTNQQNYMGRPSVAPMQHFIYNYNQHPLNRIPQQQAHLQQQPQVQLQTTQIMTSNQVPIVPVNSSGNNCYINSSNNSQQPLHQLNNNHLQTVNQSLYNDSHQLYGSFAPNMSIVPMATTALDSSQQIYANAPPKPRRYQYYDSQMVPMTATLPTIDAPANGITVPHSNAYVPNQLPLPQFVRHSYGPINRQQQHIATKQQLLPNHPIYNVSYLMIPTIYQQQQADGLNQINAQSQFDSLYVQPPQQQRLMNYPQQRQVNLPLPYQLTKSKSSLDAFDLMRFKLDKQNYDTQAKLANNAGVQLEQHPQHQQHPQQQHPQQRHPLQQQQQQPRQMRLPNQLTKSKSSLDAFDLMRFELDKQKYDTQSQIGHNQRVQVNQQHQPMQQQQQLSQHQPMYSSQLNNRNGYMGVQPNQQVSGAQFLNPYLIVDLTTPRVLAKTQTTLSSSTNGTPEATASRDTWSMVNQVGLPQPVSQTSTLSRPNPRKAISSLDLRKTSLLSLTTDNNTAPYKEQKMGDSSERTAPYYYSDLKSEEQRKALLNIVQQKSLSPPPQLLSRSTDQNNTRLALKSATLHSGQAKVLSESLAKRQLVGRVGNLTSNLKPAQPADFSSASNIAKNIDKLFEASDQTLSDQKITTVQSLLTLNDADTSRLSSFDTAPDSIGSGYYSGETKSKSFSKSKSLENISNSRSNSINCFGAEENKFSDSVYQNIRQSDKLMSAINDSTTCLSTSRKPNQRAVSPANEQDLMLRDDEDFIEFLSTDESSHKSQFEASQFSASDFNTSTSASESSAANDSLNSPVNSSPAKHLFTNGSSAKTGILKHNTKPELNSGSNNNTSGSIVNINNNNNNKRERNNNLGNKMLNELRDNGGDNERQKFDNVLGNVIDVDVVPMNNLSQCSPVNNRAAC